MVRQANKERRSHIRAKRILSIQFRVKPKSRKDVNRPWGISITEDMSPAGLSFYTEREYKVGDILELHVIMSGFWNLYQGLAQIVRVQRKTSGACYWVAVRLIGHHEIIQPVNGLCGAVARSRMRKRI